MNIEITTLERCTTLWSILKFQACSSGHIMGKGITTKGISKATTISKECVENVICNHCCNVSPK
jgi:hypothetical protein